jgi:hypothetical protein
MVDTKTIYGYWAYLCEECNDRYGLKQWNTLLAGLSEGGTPLPKEYEWDESKSFYTQTIYLDVRKALAMNTIMITMKSGKTKLITEGNIPLLRCIMNIAMQDKDYPVQWKAVEL